MNPNTQYLESAVTDLSVTFFQEAELGIGHEIWDNSFTQVLRVMSDLAKDRKYDIRNYVSKYIVKNSINQKIFLFSPHLQS